MAKNISILGSTGSIGTQSLDVIKRFPEMRVCAISGNSNLSLLERQIREFKPEIAGVPDEKKAKELALLVRDTNTKIVCGEEGLCEIASYPKTDTVITSIVGIAGLIPTMSAIENKKNIALANKETLVTAGDIVMKKAKENGVLITPVDSEHSAIFQCIGNHKNKDIDKLIITASGGSFYGKTRKELENCTVKEALNHPNWSMGQKITIDSATLMNKGLEVIEAHHLFNMDYSDIDVVIHRESIVHSLVQFKDTSVLAQLGLPDMRLPIHYALCYPERIPSGLRTLNLAEVGKLTFDKPDYETFGCLKLAINAGQEGGTMPVVLNAANEAAVAKFLKGEIKFLQIEEIVRECLLRHKTVLNPNIADIIYTDREVRNEVNNLC